jgi:hypothetical protein
MLSAVLLAVSAGNSQTVAAAAGHKEKRQLAMRPSDGEIVSDIRRYQRTTWHWQRVFGLRPTPTRRTAERSPDREYKLWVRRLWRGRAARTMARAQNPPHKREWQCIHRYEGHWRAMPGGPGELNSGGPYYGGLQMDIDFQRTYGSYLLAKRGTADRWTPLEQMWVAERAHRTRGFTPWPNTARICGLL